MPYSSWRGGPTWVVPHTARFLRVDDGNNLPSPNYGVRAEIKKRLVDSDVQEADAAFMYESVSKTFYFRHLRSTRRTLRCFYSYVHS